MFCYDAENVSWIIAPVISLSCAHANANILMFWRNERCKDADIFLHLLCLLLSEHLLHQLETVNSTFFSCKFSCMRLSFGFFLNLVFAFPVSTCDMSYMALFFPSLAHLIEMVNFHFGLVMPSNVIAELILLCKILVLHIVWRIFVRFK